MKVSKEKKSSAAGLIIVVLAIALSQSGLFRTHDKQQNQDANQPAIEIIQDVPEADQSSTIAYPTDQSSTTNTASYRVDRMEIPRVFTSGEGQRIDYTGHSLYYNEDMRTPVWVAWEITREEASQKKVDREVEFTPDPMIDGVKAYYYDYNSSGYDRGHMAPAGDMKWDSKAMEEVFYMSNICPQNHDFNAGAWLTTENMARRIARQYGSVYVVCGPIVTDNKYGTIGEHKVTVPDAFFKAFLIKDGGEYSAIGIVMYNTSERQLLKASAMTVDELEEKCGLDLFTSLDRTIQDEVEARINWSKWGKWGI